MQNFYIQNRWVYKNVVSGFCILFFTLFLCGLFIKITVPDTDYSDPDLLFVISVFLIVYILYEIADYRISKVRKNNFTFSLSNDSISFKQAVLFADTTKVVSAGQVLGYIYSSIMLIRVGAKILRQNEFNAPYSDIESFYVKRGLWDRLFGFYNLIFTFKNTKYSTFCPPGTSGVVGISSPDGTIRSEFKTGNIAVIPGISKQQLNEITKVLRQKVSGNNKSSVPKQTTISGFIGAVLYGILAFFIITMIITWILS